MSTVASAIFFWVHSPVISLLSAWYQPVLPSTFLSLLWVFLWKSIADVMLAVSYLQPPFLHKFIRDVTSTFHSFSRHFFPKRLLLSDTIESLCIRTIVNKIWADRPKQRTTRERGGEMRWEKDKGKERRCSRKSFLKEDRSGLSQLRRWVHLYGTADEGLAWAPAGLVKWADPTDHHGLYKQLGGNLD